MTLAELYTEIEALLEVCPPDMPVFVSPSDDEELSKATYIAPWFSDPDSETEPEKSGYIEIG